MIGRAASKRHTPSAFRTGWESGFSAAGEFASRPRRRRPKLSDRYPDGSGWKSDLDKAWQDLSQAIQAQAGKYFHDNYLVTLYLDNAGRLQFAYKQKPKNKKMEDAGGWGK